ncbi:MAG: hypothetical protein H0V70_29815 [Ktedonobacteraceae bacterium]|nr:hypothetical protein [Ktedonobacteraceae bacterium]
MNPTVITYLGFFVAALILLWAVVEIGRRFYKRKKIDARVIRTWIPLQPSTEVEPENTTPDDTSPPRSQQNGHYSESKKL